MATPNASPSAAEKDRNTPIPVPVTGSSQAACPGPACAPAGAPVPNASPSPGASRGCASSAGEPSAASFSASRTTSSIWSARTPARDTTPVRAAVPSRLIATTVSWRERDTPFVVSVFPAQRRFADEVSSAITTQSSHRAAASARSTVSCGPMPSWFPAGAVMFLPPRC